MLCGLRHVGLLEKRACLAWLTALAGILLAGILTPAAGAVPLGSLPREPTPTEPTVLAQPASAAQLGYSLTPSRTEPYAVCTSSPGRMGCLSIADPPAVKTASGYKILGAGPSLEGGGEGGGIDPKELQEAYKIPATGGTTQTVAIVDAYDDPNAEADLAKYREKYKLPECKKENAKKEVTHCFRKINQKGEEGNYPTDRYPRLSFGLEDWGLEISLDLDMVSAACPECHILLVEATNDENANLYAAEKEAASFEGTTEISNSWGEEEYAEEATADTNFNHSGIPTTVAAGDSGYGVQYPAASKDVISVGGTTLKKKAEGERGWEDSVWADSGGGCSRYESKPTWQTDPGCLERTDNDVAAVANYSESPVSVYDSYEYEEEGIGTGKLGWVLLGGTSVAAPLVAGIEAHASTTVRDEGAEAFYRHSLFDVISGSNGVCQHTYLCEAEEGYDGPTGWGSPNGPPELAVGSHAITEAATSVTSTGAALNGYVNPGGLVTTYHFEYGTTTSYGTNVPVPNANAGLGTSWTRVSQSITGLHTLQGTYHYRLVATNSSGTIYGADHTFTTIPWVVQTTPNPTEWGEGRLEGVSCSSSTACTAVSSYESESESTRWALVDRWNGGEWQLQSTPKPTGATYVWLYGVSCVSSTACTAVGFDGNSSGTFFTLAEAWNGTEWSIHTTPSKSGSSTSGGESELVGVSCSSASLCTAVGYYCEPEGTECSYRSNGGSATPLAERWNGTEWSVQTIHSPTGAKASNLHSVSCVSTTECITVGSYTNSSGVVVPLAERWNGTEWSVHAIPSPTGAESSALSSVACTSSTECVSVGSYTNSSGVVVPLAERWNGTEWTIQTTPTPPGGHGELSGVSCASSAECIAVGGRLSERWNGTEWSIEPIAIPEEPPGFEDFSLSGLSCSSSRSCIAVGTHIGWAKGGLGHFSTLAESRAGVKPYVETGQATSTGESGATLNGVVNPEGVETKYYFEYGPTTSYGSRTAEVNVGSGTSNLEESKTVTGLAVSTTYHYRIVATNSDGTTDGIDQVFSTTGKPTVETQAATLVGETYAQLNGVVNPRGAETKYYFEYGPTISYGSHTAEASAGSGITNLNEHGLLTGFTASTTYHFRIVATSSKGTTYGSDQTFSTTGKPTVETQVATSIGEAGATLNGIVNPRSAETKYYFEYGPTTSYGSKTAEASAGSGTSNLEESKTVTGLAPSTTYHFRIVATNSKGSADGADQVFTTVGWSLRSTPNPAGALSSALAGAPFDGGTHVSCSSSSACTGVGFYTNSLGIPSTLAERWNGSEWSIQSTPNPSGAADSYLHGVSCSSSSACTAVGHYKNSSGTYVTLAERWNGSEWSIQSTPNPSGATESFLEDVSCSSATACIAVGWYKNSAGTDVTLAERWNGSEWSIQSTPNPEAHGGEVLNVSDFISVSCSSSTACTGVGLYKTNASPYLTLAERWNGSEWSVESTPNPSGATRSEITAVSCTSSSGCTAVGTYVPSSGTYVTLAERWNGSEWSIQSTPNPSGATESVLGGVSCSSSTVCTGVGYDKNSAGTDVTLAERWNGSEWSIQSTPNPSGATESELSGVSCFSSTGCIAVGFYRNSSGTEVTLAEVYG
jgi:hypothetical protein